MRVHFSKSLSVSRAAKEKANSRAFTLIELMIVVAIIGILAAVAIPQFQTFQAKAKRSEAMTMLAGMVVAVDAYAAEHDTVFMHHDQLGFDAPTNGRYHYAYSGSTDNWEAISPNVSASCAPSVVSPSLGGTHWLNGAGFDDVCGTAPIASGDIDGDSFCDVILASRPNLQNSGYAPGGDCDIAGAFMPPTLFIDDLSDEILGGGS